MNQARLLFCALLAGLGGCTAITEAGDYKVDASAFVRDLDLTLVDMGAHRSNFFPDEGPQQLDVAIIDEEDLIQGRALVWLRNHPFERDDYPNERIVMQNALAPGKMRVFFYVDSNRDYEVQRTEHQWIKTLEADGSFEFVHSTMFQQFDTGDYTADPFVDLVLTYDQLQQQVAFQRFLELHDLELRVSLSNEEREVGLFRAYKGTSMRVALLGTQIELRNILDVASEYLITAVVDGEARTPLVVLAPADGTDLVVPISDLLPEGL